MVVFVDLEDEGLEPEEDPLKEPFPATKLYHSISHVDKPTNRDLEDLDSPNHNNQGFSAALACYPWVTSSEPITSAYDSSVAIQLACYLDLNTLHALARVCRQFRSNLLQFRSQLIARTLRCTTELSDAFEEETINHGPRYRSWDVIGSTGIPASRITSVKIGPCARDMVSDCRRCGRIVCRNCITKPRSAVALPLRLRRLCKACTRAPLPMLTNSRNEMGEVSFTSGAFARQPCTCMEVAFICQPCGHAIQNADTQYRRIWEWRTRYSTYLNGLTGIAGPGNEGVECARGESCIAAHDIEVEVDCKPTEHTPAQVLLDFENQARGGLSPDPGGRDEEKAGYLRQEIDGIGGVVRTKIKKRARVGGAVEESEQEAEKGEFMATEVCGDSRSWCGWCSRVVLGRKEMANSRVKH